MKKWIYDEQWHFKDYYFFQTENLAYIHIKYHMNNKY